MNGWVGGKAGFRIPYSNQKNWFCKTTILKYENEKLKWKNGGHKKAFKVMTENGYSNV